MTCIIPKDTEGDGGSREVCCLVLDGKLQDLEDGELAELATIGIQSIEEGLAAIQESQGSLQTVSCTGSRHRTSRIIWHAVGDDQMTSAVKCL